MESTVTISIIIAGAVIGGIALALILWKRLLQWGHSTIRSWVKRRWPTFLGAVDFAFEVLDKATVYASDTIERIVRSWRELRTRLLKQEIQIERRGDGQYTRLVVNWMYEPELGEKKIIREVQEEQVRWEDLPLDEETKRKLIRQNQAVINLTEERDKQVMQYAQQM